MSLRILPLPGTEKIVLQNSYKEKMDVSWFPIFTTCLSAIGILFGGHWIVQPLEDITNCLTGKLTFLSIFFYRMVAWQIIIITLERFSILPFAMFIFVNFLVLCLIQRKITVEPFSSSCLSVVFPMYKLPSQNLESKLSLKMLTWLVLIGNFFLLFSYIILFLLYHFDLYNPWCNEGQVSISSTFYKQFFGPKVFWAAFL